MEHRYILEPYKGISSRYSCPGCKRARTFSLYVDTETGKHINPTVGRCNRESNCGYHLTPRQYFQDNNFIQFSTPQNNLPIKKQEPLPYSYIHVEAFKTSLKEYISNTFIKYLTGQFGKETTEKVISRYFIGSSKKRFTSKDYPGYESETGATIFWQIDCKGRIRTGKIMLYSPITGKRVKQPFNHITWVHKQLKQPQLVLNQCLFGEHLLRSEPQKPVAIVESEKTAIIASVYFPEFIWLAAGSLNNLNKQKCRVLAGRNVTLFPDLNGYEKWSQKAKELSSITTIQVSNLLERKATQAERQQGLDLADYLIKYDYREFINGFDKNTNESHILELKNLETPDFSEISIKRLKNAIIPENENLIIPEIKKVKQTWEQEIQELEQFFINLPNPLQTISLSPGNSITNLPLFIDAHLTAIKFNNGNKTFLPYLNRLQLLKHQLIK
ncbi:hypothetical protein GXP67_33285 [Rhodocytophaga rosea]|uniref:Toprim domain-containing protein n=1 Tax=Rhodocytophaga rosea TaxID=2704465 RepID=A0A6C0GV21_9BACT|nr:DUF6371 domain-containing protein [Rhodocytophaga rosea]QHT71182.1 hypothetical protein GXP67_33285 [Rhodocytophaga rosea]